MNFGPLEFAAYLRRRNVRHGDSAAVRAARAAAPPPRTDTNHLAIVTGPSQLARVARGAQVDSVSVYEAIATSTGSVRVVVSPSQRPVVLVLSSHQAVEWRIETEPGAILQAVLLAGSGESRVTGVAEALVSSIGGYYAFKRSSHEFQHLEREVMRCTGRTIENFHSVYAGSEFRI